MKAILDIGVLCVTVLMMGAVGMELEGRHLRAVMRQMGALVLTLTTQAVILPALGSGLTRALALPPDLSAGIFLLAVRPVGDIANVYTLLARANVVLSVTLNAVSILLAAGTMAVVFEAYDHLLGAHFVFAVPTPTLLGPLLLMLVLPVLAVVYFLTEAPLLIGLVAGYRAWWAPAVPRLPCLATFGDTMTQSEAEPHKELEARLQFETLLADLSARFVNPPAEQVDRASTDAQWQIAETLGLDRSTLAQLDEAQEHLVVTYAWVLPGFEST